MAKGDMKTCKGKRRAHSHVNARLTTEGQRKHHQA